MTKNDDAAQDASGFPPSQRRDLRTLVVGDIRRWTARGQGLPEVDGLRFIDLDELSDSLLRDMQPDLILSPLIEDAYGALEVAGILQDLNFKGRYRAVAEALPNIAMIRSEIARAAPDIDFDLIGLPAAGVQAR